MDATYALVRLKNTTLLSLPVGARVYCPGGTNEFPKGKLKAQLRERNLLTYWENKTDSGNPKNINYGINLQSEICQPGSGSKKVRGSYNQGDGDDSTRGDLYMPGGVEG